MESLTTKEKQLLKKLKGSSVIAAAEQLENWITVMSLRDALSIPGMGLKVSSRAKALYLSLPGKDDRRIYKSKNISNEQILQDIDRAQIWEVKDEFESSNGGMLPAGLQLIILPSSGKNDEEIDLSDYL